MVFDKNSIILIAICLVAGFAGALLFKSLTADSDNLARDAHLAVPLTEISSYTLLQKMDSNSNDFLIVDARDKASYDRGHIKGAISIPISEVSSRLSELPRDKDIIVYCWSSECMLAPTFTSKLAELGVYNTKELRIGWCEWSERGYPIDGERYILENECLVPQRSINGEAVKIIRENENSEAVTCVKGEENC